MMGNYKLTRSKDIIENAIEEIVIFIASLAITIVVAGVILPVVEWLL